VRHRARVIRSDSEELGLGRSEFLIGEHALGVKLRQVLELCVCVVLWRRWRCLLLVLLRVLLVPLFGLTTLHAPGHGGSSSRDDRGAGCHT
jgi:hypothetical protein